jgi:hypothetical protein
MYRYVSFLFLLLFFSAYANQTITGIVKDAQTSQPVSFANVFFSHTLIGTTTDENGEFELEFSLQQESLQLVVQHIGYDMFITEIVAGHIPEKKLYIYLDPHVIEGEELVVVGKDPKGWQENFEKFEKLFLGYSDNAEQCQIVNPHVLEFHKPAYGFELSVISREPVVVENLALGYKIDVHIRKFTSYVDQVRYILYTRFYELQPSDPKVERIWHQNRMQTYYGSIRHFIRALALGELEQEKFIIPNAFTVDDTTFLIKPPASSLADLRRKEGSYGFKVRGLNKNIEFNTDKIQIYYKTQSQDAHSYLNILTHPVEIDTLGNIYTPLAIATRGKWYQMRVADLLPWSFNPN